MRLLVLAYHDIIEPGGETASGRQGPSENTYKLTIERFQAHLDVFRRVAGNSPFRLLLTFDDGGTGALFAADLIEKAGYRGHFFITTQWIGLPGFLSANEIAQLHARGHTIGSHGETHHGRMNRMSDRDLRFEWSSSVEKLAAITGAPVHSASVPSGFYSPRVARFAAEAGIRRIFTQQPTTKTQQAFGCEVLGRFTMRSWTPLERVAAFARGDVRPRFEEAAFWRLRWIAKTLAGGLYRDLRQRFFDHRSAVRPASS